MSSRIILTIVLGLTVNGLATAYAADADPKLVKPANPPANAADPLKKYDKNGDGKLDDKEKAELHKDLEAQRKQAMADLLKKYDKNGNGKWDEDERLARQEDLRKEREAQLAKRQSERKVKEDKAKEPKDPKHEEKK